MASSGVKASVAGETREYRGREIILCGGGIQSPTLLLRSGIGPAPQLRAHDVHLPAHLLLDLLLLVDDAQVGLDVLGPDRLGPLEHHVLEEMADAGDPLPLVDGDDVGDPARGHGRRFVPLEEEETHAVREPQLLDVDARLLRGRQQAREQEGKGGAEAPEDVHGVEPLSG